MYTIKLIYCFKVEAPSRETALSKAKKLIQQSPEMVISDVFYGPQPSKKGLLSRLLFGD